MKIKYLALSFVFLFNLAVAKGSDKISVPFSEPSRPGFIEVDLISGSIKVIGYKGKEVMIEAVHRTEEDDDGEHEHDRRNKGMKRLSRTSTGLEVEEQYNQMSISAGSHYRTIDINLKVPVNTSLQLSTVNNGDVFVENIIGEVEINNVNGEIKAMNISGSVVANTTNGDVVVTFKKVTPDKPMSFASFNGDVDITFVGNLKADVKIKSEHGELFSDYDVTLAEKTNMIKEDNRGRGGKFRLKMESYIYGQINGGGPEYYFSTFNGEIFIRKGK